MRWVLDIQLGRCNLSPIAVAEKYRPLYEKQAKEKMSEGGGDNRSNNYKNSSSPNGEKRSETKIHTDKELARMAGVGTGLLLLLLGDHTTYLVLILWCAYDF